MKGALPMYEFEFDGEELTVDYWSKRLAAARKIRPDVWFEIMEDWRAAGGVLDFDASPVQALFCALRIDGARALRMLNARGDISAAPIDPAPEHAQSGESQVLGDELANEERTFEAIETRLGMGGIDLGDPDDVEAFYAMRMTLQSEGKILPGMRGYLRG